MIIRKGGKTTDKCDRKVTDHIPLSHAFKDDQSPLDVIWFDGTIDKSGTKDTEIGLQFSLQDILFLNESLIRHQNSRLVELQETNRRLAKTLRERERALGAIGRVLSNQKNGAPTVDKLMENLKNIAEALPAKQEEAQCA